MNVRRLLRTGAKTLAGAVGVVGGAVAVASIVSPRRRAGADVEIDASPGRVWWVLTDFDGYAEWNPYIVRADGTPRQGEHVKVTVKPPGGPSLTFRPVIAVCRPGQRLSLLGRRFLPALWQADHSVTITPLGSQSRVRVSQETTFRGARSVLLGRPFVEAVRSGLQEMNEALKARAEAHASAAVPKTITR